MNKIKILFLEPHLSTGGAPSFALRRIKALVKHDIFEIFVVEHSNISDTYVVQKNEIKKLIKPENFITLGDDKSQIINIIKNNKIDILHSEEILEGYDGYTKLSNNILNELFSNERTWKIVETCHNIWFNPNGRKFHPDAYAFCTEWHKQRTFSQMPSYSEVIEFPIENKLPTPDQKLEARRKLGIDLYKKHIINIGLWTPGKNQKEGVEVARLLQESNPEMQFHFIGNQAGNFESYWKPIMQNLPNNVTVWGERMDTDTFLTAADVFMFNSTWECNPIVLREATSYGLKILSRNLEQYMGKFDPYIIEINDDIDTTKYKLISVFNFERNYDITDTYSQFETKYIEFYKKVNRLPIMRQSEQPSKINITQHFVGNPFIEIKGDPGPEKYKIEFFDEGGNCHYSETLSVNHWIKLNREYFTKWNAKIWENDTLIYDHTLNLKDRKVFITLESRSLGDTLAWIPYIREFKDKHGCRLVVSTFMNGLFRDTYPDIEFVEPGTIVNDLYAMYRIGWFYKDDGSINFNRNKIDFRLQPLQKTATDILGLEYTETKPIIKIPEVIKQKKVGIGLHATCQAKYWNNPNGWQEVVDYLKELDYEVALYSREIDGYMGNNHPTGIKKFESGPIDKLIDDLSTCQLFIGVGSGLTWLAWSLNIPTILISGFSHDYTEMSNVSRIINRNVCTGCFNRYRLSANDWNWCPDHKGTDRQFECTKQILSDIVIQEIKKIIKL